MPEEGNLRISYAVKDILERIDNRLISMDAKLDSKASIEVVSHLEDRVEKLEKLYDLQAAISSDRARVAEQMFTRREKFLGLLLVLMGLSLQALGHPINFHF